MDRTPPASIRRLLRREVNFGCPVPSCGSPYLQYHHFDPPFSEEQHHNPEGMIALCTKHHPWADSGKWSNQELHRMKEKPFFRSDRLAVDGFGWRKRELILAAGGFYVRPAVFLRLNGRNVVWCDRDAEGILELNIDIRDQDDKPVILMQGDDWLELRGIERMQDIEVSPHGHTLVIRAPSLGVRTFEIRFREFTHQKLRRLGQIWCMELDSRPGLQESLPEWMIDALARDIGQPHSGYLRQHLPMLRQLVQPLPTRWELLSRAISEPVTICTMRLSLQHSCEIDIGPGSENVGGWRASHTIAFEPGVVWDIQL